MTNRTGACSARNRKAELCPAWSNPTELYIVGRVAIAKVVSMTAETIARELGGKRAGSGYVAKCPAHDDTNPSLSITERNGKILVHCFGGCSQQTVIDALRSIGLWPTPEPPTPEVRQQWQRDREDTQAAGWWARCAAAYCEQMLDEVLLDTDPQRATFTRLLSRIKDGESSTLAAYREFRSEAPKQTAAMGREKMGNKTAPVGSPTIARRSSAYSSAVRFEPSDRAAIAEVLL